MNSLLTYLLKKIFYAILIVLGSSILTFILFNLVVGDPTLVLLGKHATPEARAILREELGLNQPLYVQYLDLLRSVFTFQFGHSWSSKQNILTMLKEGMCISLTVTVPSFVIANTLLVVVSLLMVKHRNTKLDRYFVVACIVMASIPLLVCVLFMQGFFAYKLGLFPITGYERGFPYFVPYVILPVIIDVWLDFTSSYRYFRNIMLDEAYNDYVRTALAKGLTQNMVLFKHIFRNAIIPIVSYLVQRIPSLVFGSVVMENFFSIPGLGNIVVNAINTCDFPTIKAVTVISTIFCIAANLAGDILYRVMDPRVKI